MTSLTAKSIFIFVILIVQIYHITANKTAHSSQQINESSADDLRKHIHISCPSLVRPNNWEIEKFFGNWSGIELYSHKILQNDSFEDACVRIYIVEVNEQHEEMTYGKPIDPFNFRLALRHLKVVVYTNSIQTQEYFMTFNNTNQMVWYGSEMRMQVIKFDGKQLMLTICAMDKGKIYTILSNRYGENGTEYLVGNVHLNRLILQGRNLKIHSNYNLRSNCNGCVQLRINLFIILIALLRFMLFCSV